MKTVARPYLPKDVTKAFTLSRAALAAIIRDFRVEMERGLAGRRSSLKMIPTFVDRPTGGERGVFLALDLGGTNFRVLELTLKGRGKIAAPRSGAFLLRREHITGDGAVLFDFIARCVAKFIRAERIRTDREISLGFTFSFPVRQTGIASGELVAWTKGFDARGVVGNDVVGLLNIALSRVGLTSIHVAALANDTVGTLAAGAYGDRSCDIGVIIGTGTNACYVERIGRIGKWRGAGAKSAGMIVNTEWGNFNRLPLTKYDRALDAASDRPGEQLLEKTISGMYLGELARRVIADMISKKELPTLMPGAIFHSEYAFKTEHISLIEEDRSAKLSAVDNFLRANGVDASTLSDRASLKEICALVSRRAARIAAAVTAVLIQKMDPRLARAHTIAIDGSVYEKHPVFGANLEASLREIFGKKASRIRLILAKDGSGKGAAVIAAVASSMDAA